MAQHKRFFFWQQITDYICNVNWDQIKTLVEEGLLEIYGKLLRENTIPIPMQFEFLENIEIVMRCEKEQTNNNDCQCKEQMEKHGILHFIQNIHQFQPNDTEFHEICANMLQMYWPDLPQNGAT